VNGIHVWVSGNKYSLPTLTSSPNLITTMSVGNMSGMLILTLTLRPRL